MVYSLLLTWFRSLRMASWARRVLGGMAVAVIIVACLPYFLHAGPAPAWLGDFAGQLAANQGMQMQVKAIRMEGWGRATLEDVVLLPRDRVPGLEEVSAEQVVIIFDWLPLIQGRIPQVREIRLQSPDVIAKLPEVAPPAREPAEGSKAPTSPGAVPSEESIPAIDLSHPIRLVVREGHLRLQDEAFALEAVLDAKGTIMADGLRVDQWKMDIRGDRFAGILQGDGQVEWGQTPIQLKGSARGEQIRFAAGDDMYHIGKANVQYGYDDGVWSIDALGEGHDNSRIAVSGEMSSRQGLAFDIHATGLDLAAEIPFLEQYGFAGESTFAGTLEGPIDDFVLQGNATIGPGQVWGRPHRRAEGFIAVTGKDLVFSDVSVHQEVGRYDLDGTFIFARPEEGFPGYLDIDLDTRAGRLYDLLAILEVDDLPLSGRINGTLSFAGLLGEIGAAGDVEVLDARAWDQAFDRITGVFAWDAGRLNLHGVQATLGAGRLETDGSIAMREGPDEGTVDLRFAAIEWPLGDTQVFQENLGHVVGGRIDASGRLAGSLAEPVLMAQVMSDGLRLGPTAFHEIHGSIHLSTEGLTVDGLTAVRSGGGLYQVSGGFRPDDAGGITTETIVMVDDEQLRDLLQLIGQDLPAALINGPVTGQIEVSGEVSQPKARLNLLWADAKGATSGVELALELAERELRVSRFGFTGGEYRS